MISYRRCDWCGQRIEFEREEEYQAHRRGCHYRIAQQAGQEDTYLKAGRGLQRQQEYNRQCEENYHRLRLLVSQGVEATRTETLSRQTWENLRNAQDELKRTKPLRRDQRDELWRALQQGFDNENRKREAHRRERERKQREWQERQDAWHEQKRREFEERQRERERKRREWQERQRERIQRLKDAISRLDDSLSRDHLFLRDLNRKFTNVRPGRRASEIRYELQKKIDNINRRITEKQRARTEMSRDLSEMELELAKA